MMQQEPEVEPEVEPAVEGPGEDSKTKDVDTAANEGGCHDLRPSVWPLHTKWTEPTRLTLSYGE